MDKLSGAQLDILLEGGKMEKCRAPPKHFFLGGGARKMNNEKN